MQTPGCLRASRPGAPLVEFRTSIGGFVLVAGLAGALYTPALKRQIQLLDTDGPTGGAFKAAGARAAGVGVFLGVLLIAIVFVMVFKPQI